MSWMSDADGDEKRYERGLLAVFYTLVVDSIASCSVLGAIDPGIEISLATRTDQAELHVVAA